jgi:hypothetical protein
MSKTTSKFEFPEFQNVYKQYKDKTKTPKSTCDKIQTIINELFNGTTFSHKIFSLKSVFNDIWTCLNVIKNDKRPFLIVGGKGISKDLAKASGFGELMERLQVGYFFSTNPYRTRIFPEYVRDVSKEVKEFNMNIRNRARKENNPYLPDLNLDDAIYLEFSDIFNRKTPLIESSMVYHANGCASGNSREEAFVQALCELFERYSALKIISNKLPCPNIPIKCLSKEIVDLISTFERNGIKITVKDFSLGKAMPVVGVLFRYEKLGELELKVGSATSINVAVERCLTELLQIIGLSILKRTIYKSKLDNIIKGHILRSKNHFKIAHTLYDTFPYLEKYLPYHWFISSRYPRHGFFPSDSLRFLELDSGKFFKWDYFRMDVKEEIDLLIEWIKRRDYRLFLKDYSWLGFPALKLFIPELYFGFKEHLLVSTSQIENFKVKLLRDINRITIRDLRILENPRFLLHLCLNNSLIKFFKVLYTETDLFNCWAFFGLLAKIKGKKNIAKKYLKLAFISGGNPQLIKNILKNKNSDEALSYLEDKLPNCFQSCKNCQFEDTCKFPILQKFQLKIKDIYPDFFSELRPRN